MPTAQVRSFVAVSLGNELKGELAALQAKLKNPPKPWIKWVDPENIHITLKFLGDTPLDKIETVKAVITGAAQGVKPFKLKAEGLGVFPNTIRAQVIWVGLTGDTHKLNELQQRLEKRLETIGFPSENRKFSAHLTLGRVRREATSYQQQEAGKLVETIQYRFDSEISVKSIQLMKSQLTPKGPIYTRLTEVPLENN